MPIMSVLNRADECLGDSGMGERGYEGPAGGTKERPVLVQLAISSWPSIFCNSSLAAEVSSGFSLNLSFQKT